MQKLAKIFELKTYAITVVATVGFAAFVAHLFGQTIPGIVITFFKDAGESVILCAVFVFALAWLIKAKPHNRPKKYSVITFDVYGKQVSIDGLRSEFKTHDVAWSFMKQYKKRYPLYNFALVTNLPKSDKPTIFRYI